MSLDVYLTIEDASLSSGSGIFVRESGQVKEVTRAEWDEKFPNREPVTAINQHDDKVYWANITHNLGMMASQAGIYKCLWRPDEIGIEKAGQLIGPLETGLVLLGSDPVRFKEFNPENGWGSYAELISFVRGYLEACKKWPNATISVSR